MAKDNVVVSVQTLKKPNEEIDQNRTIVLSVFDGNGGHFASQYAAKHVRETYNRMLFLSKEDYNNHPASVSKHL